MKRPCIEPGCPHLTEGTRCTEHERKRVDRRNHSPAHKALYGGGWARHSRQRRAEQPWCSMCYVTTDLTLDHPTDAVVCRSCNVKLEARRRRGVGRNLGA